MERKTYIIMHGEQPTAKIDGSGGCEIYAEALIPYDLYFEEGGDLDTRLNNIEVFRHWCASRVLTLDRQYAKELLNSIGMTQNQTDAARAAIALSYHCLTLTDIFWVKAEDEHVSFAEINLYENHLNNSFVDISLRGRQMSVTNAHLVASDLSTGGCFPKAWYRAEDGFYLYKDGGEDAVKREILASKICRCFKCEQVLYELGLFEGQPVSVSHIVTSKEYSLVPYEAFDIYCANHELDTLNEILRIDAYNYYMMNILDYLTGNTDRHWGNWGLLVSNADNKPVRLHDLMDFNRAFNAYDTLDGANCLTAKGYITQRQAAEEAVKAVGLNQIKEVTLDILEDLEQYRPMFECRLQHLKECR